MILYFIMKIKMNKSLYRFYFVDLIDLFNIYSAI